MNWRVAWVWLFLLKSGWWQKKWVGYRVEGLRCVIAGWNLIVCWEGFIGGSVVLVAVNEERLRNLVKYTLLEQTGNFYSIFNTFFSRFY